MKVLIVARCKDGRYAPFVTEQAAALERHGSECRLFGVQSKGYIKQLPELHRVIRDFRPNVIHAHYGLCGVLANLQRRVPVVTTYHGSDINNPKILKLSRIAIKLSGFNVFVSQKNMDTVSPSGNFALIPCGIDLDDYPPAGKEEARKAMGLAPGGRYVLFAGAFDNPVKNAPLAKEAVSLLEDAELLELKGYSRSEVALLMQAADAFLMTSFTEGSPQVIKEAMACGCPVVSVDVGDVGELIATTEGCFIAERDAGDIACKLRQALSFRGRTRGRDAIIERKLTNDNIAVNLNRIYFALIHNV